MNHKVARIRDLLFHFRGEWFRAKEIAHILKGDDYSRATQWGSEAMSELMWRQMVGDDQPDIEMNLMKQYRYKAAREL